MVTRSKKLTSSGRRFPLNNPDDLPQGDAAVVPSFDKPSSALSPETRIKRKPNPAKRLLKILGPGFITGASDDDPSGIGTYAVTGARFGPTFLWAAWVTFPLMTAIQFICAKIGMVSGQGLAGVLKNHYPRWLLYVMVTGLLIANTINAGADIGAIAAALNLLLPIPVIWMIVPVTLTMLALQVFGSYRLISTVFKWLALALLAYIGSSLLARPNLGEVLRGTLLPTFRTDSSFLTTLVAILGTTISPYLFFWQASEEVEEETSRGKRHLRQRRGASSDELKHAAWDVNIGMFFSNLVMYFVILGTAATLFKSGQHDIKSATDAAQALRPLAGDLSAVLLAIGLTGIGVLAVPVLTGSAAYALCETFGWKYGLDTRPSRAKQFYAIIAVATLVAMTINFVGINPIDALFWTAVINGVVAVPLLVLIMLIANNRAIMGSRVNNRWTNVLGWIATIAMGLAALGMFATWGQ